MGSRPFRSPSHLPAMRMFWVTIFTRIAPDQWSPLLKRLPSRMPPPAAMHAAPTIPFSATLPLAFRMLIHRRFELRVLTRERCRDPKIADATGPLQFAQEAELIICISETMHGDQVDFVRSQALERALDLGEARLPAARAAVPANSDFWARNRRLRFPNLEMSWPTSGSP